MRNPLLVLVLGFGDVDSKCRHEDAFQIVCTGVVRNFQNRLLAVASDPSASYSVAAFASGLSLVHPSGLTVCRQRLQEGQHSTLMARQTRFCPISLLDTFTTSSNQTSIKHAKKKTTIRISQKKKLREQLRVIVKIETFVFDRKCGLSSSGWHLTVWLHCFAVCSGSVCVVERGDSQKVFTIWSLSCFSFTTVAAPAVIRVQLPYLFLTACQSHLHHRK